MSNEDRDQEEQLEETPEADPMADYDSRINELEAQLEAANNERLRAIADFQNFRRRNQQDMLTFRKLATENLISDLLPILDNFERTLQHLQAGVDPEKMLTGILAVEKQLRSVLEAQNLKRISALGEPFDPDMHEAVAVEPSDEHPDDTVIAELEPGYKLGDKVIRPARVKVARSQ
ncbi:nucleotide exchange factor GrpE [soil metagenome]